MSLASSRLLVCVGPGGVGKTTMSAALALRVALSGKRVALLTLDPAKRLADALGLSELSDALTPIDLSALSPTPGGALSACMVDTKESADSLFRRIGTEEQVQRVLDNRVYAAFSKTLERTHAYTAMERLYEVLQSDEYDVVVVDTPPARNALTILDAPQRLIRFLDARVLKWFLAGSTSFASPLYWLSKLIGKGIVDELAGFLGSMAELREGFHTRATEVTAALSAPDTAFILVTTPTVTALGDTSNLGEELSARGSTPHTLFLNRAFVPEPGKDELAHSVSGSASTPLEEALFAAREAVNKDNARRESIVGRFTNELPKGVQVRRLADRSSMDGLADLAEMFPAQALE